MRRRLKRELDMGEAISIEDALSMLIVIFVLFVIFLVPVVNLDKKLTLEKDVSDPFWSKVVGFLTTNPSSIAKSKSYKETLGLEDYTNIFTKKINNVKYVQAISSDSSISILQHHLASNTFISLFVQNQGSSIIYRTGDLIWSQAEKEWLVNNSSTMYTSNKSTEKMERTYRTWFNSK